MNKLPAVGSEVRHWMTGEAGVVVELADVDTANPSVLVRWELLSPVWMGLCQIRFWQKLRNEGITSMKIKHFPADKRHLAVRAHYCVIARFGLWASRLVNLDDGTCYLEVEAQRIMRQLARDWPLMCGLVMLGYQSSANWCAKCSFDNAGVRIAGLLNLADSQGTNGVRYLGAMRADSGGRGKARSRKAGLDVR